MSGAGGGRRGDTGSPHDMSPMGNMGAGWHLIEGGHLIHILNRGVCPAGNRRSVPDGGVEGVGVGREGGGEGRGVCGRASFFFSPPSLSLSLCLMGLAGRSLR